MSMINKEVSDFSVQAYQNNYNLAIPHYSADNRSKIYSFSDDKSSLNL